MRRESLKFYHLKSNNIPNLGIFERYQAICLIIKWQVTGIVPPDTPVAVKLKGLAVGFLTDITVLAVSTFTKQI